MRNLRTLIWTLFIVACIVVGIVSSLSLQIPTKPIAPVGTITLTDIALTVFLGIAALVLSFTLLKTRFLKIVGVFDVVICLLGAVCAVIIEI